MPLDQPTPNCTGAAVDPWKAQVEPSYSNNVEDGGKTLSSPEVQVIAQFQPRIIRVESSSSEDSETDSEINEESMRSPAWYTEKAKQCQKCKKVYRTPGEASNCLISHKRLRCYLCFRLCKNTEMLFQHYNRAHRKECREGFVECPCCERSIPFRTVSCHVISMHLTVDLDSQQLGKFIKAPRSKPGEGPIKRYLKKRGILQGPSKQASWYSSRINK